MACNTGWIDPREEEKNLQWVRAFYRDLFAETGGVPVPSDRYDGTFINHPDVELIDPTLNTSGVPWYTLYYRENYPRLQRIKERWDPRNVFHHALSVRAKRPCWSATGSRRYLSSMTLEFSRYDVRQYPTVSVT